MHDMGDPAHLQAIHGGNTPKWPFVMGKWMEMMINTQFFGGTLCLDKPTFWHGKYFRCTQTTKKPADGFSSPNP